MGLFRKSIKHSKSSKDLDNKIKNLDEDLKRAGIIAKEDDEIFCVEKAQETNNFKIIDGIDLVESKEDKLYNWRETIVEESTEHDEEDDKEVSEHRNITKVEYYISESNKELILLRDQVFEEISKETLLNLPEIKNKISKVLEIYEQIQEGLLNEPPETKNDDPLTPLNQNFITVDDLNKHYNLFINRIQEQIATIGGGGETKLQYLDDIVGIATNASAYDNKYLKYNHTIGKFEFSSIASSGSQDLNDTLLLGNTSSLGMSVGIITSTKVRVGGSTTFTEDLVVTGNARVTGILTIGTSSITLNGLDDTITIGNGVTITSSGNANYSGVITATSFVGDGSNLSGVITSIVGYATEGYVDAAVSGVSTFSGDYNDLTNKPSIPSIVGLASEGYVDAAVSGVSTFSGGYWESSTSGIHTLSNVGIGTTNPTSALTVKGNTSLETLSVSGVSTFPINVAVGVDFAHQGGGIGKFRISGDGVYGNGRLGFYDSSNNLTAAWDSYPPNGKIDIYNYTNSGTQNITISAGSSVVLQHGGTNTKLQTLGVGVTVTGTTFTNELSVSGIATIGTGVTIYGNTGIVSATTFYGNVVGNITGSITNATNLTGGTANASSLNVSGIATISQGRIQADASANLRFGNQPAGSGSGRNIAIGDQVLASLSGGQGRNIGIGELSYYDTTTGQYNIGIGERAGQKVSTGSYNVILGAYDGNSGNLDIRTSSNNVVIADGQGNIRQYINSSGNVGIKTTVVTEALTVAGIVSATGFYGSLNASQLTGSLPAIDGSSLIGVVGSGSGVVIEDDATPVGTAGTINFGSNLTVSFASGIATVTGSGLATYANVSGIATYATTAGIATNAQGLTGTPSIVVDQFEAVDGIFTGNITVVGDFNKVDSVGVLTARSGIKIGSPTTQATLSANGSAVFSGIITASSFSGSGSGLTNLPAGQLTGSLPAIDGSALLNVTAAGTGVAIEDNQVNVGSATTIDFGTGLDVTFSAGIATITSSGGSLQSRTTVTGVTTSIANNGIGNTNITGFKSYALMKVGLSTAGWLRLYTDSTSRTNDASRSIGIDPSPGSGVIAEVVTTGISTTQIISPFVMGGNLDNPADTTIYAAITNLSGSTQTITANLTILQLEA